MDINITLIGQLITFALLVWFTMRYVWPPIIKAMQERQKRIADGLAAGERGERDLELARQKSVEILHEAKQQASQLMDNANKRAAVLVDEGKETARQEAERIIKTAKDEITQLVNQAKRDLQNQASDLAIAMAEKIVQRDIDANTHRKLIDQMVAEI